MNPSNLDDTIGIYNDKEESVDAQSNNHPNYKNNITNHVMIDK